MVLCSDSTLYTGYSTNINDRIKKHNLGTGSKYTRSRRPVKLVYVELFDTKSEAMKREYFIKQLTRREKLNLISQY